MDLSCGSMSSDEIDGNISSSTEPRLGSTDSVSSDQERQDCGEVMHSQDARSPDSGKPLTPAQELRKATKPLMEKRRRARINQCLQELKDLILEALNKDPARHNKLEKADILEMAVCHLKTVQRQVRQSPKPPPESTAKYRDGYTECANEVSRFVNNVQVLQPEVKQKLIGHLSSCINTLDTTSTGPSISPPLGYPLAMSPSSQLDQQGAIAPSLPSGDRSSSPLSYSPCPPLSPSSHRSSPLPVVPQPSFNVSVPLNLTAAQLVAFPGMAPPPVTDVNNNNNNNNNIVNNYMNNNNNNLLVNNNTINLSHAGYHGTVISQHVVSQSVQRNSYDDEPMEDEGVRVEDAQNDIPLDFSKKLTPQPAPLRSGSSHSINSTTATSTTTVFPNPRKKYLASVSSGASSSSEESACTPNSSVSSTTELDFHLGPPFHLQQQRQPVNYSKNGFGGASAPRFNFADSGMTSEDDDDMWRPWNFQ